MLSDLEIELLTAFVDGELSQHQRKSAMRLLEKSSEARAMLKQLQENAHALKGLPNHKLEVSLVEDVMQAIADRRRQTQPKPMAPRCRAWLPYAAASMAVSVLIVMVGVLYWKTVIELPDGPKGGGPDFVKIDKDKKPELIVPPVTPPRKKDNPLLAIAVAVAEGAARDFSSYVPPKPYEVVFSELANAQSKESVEFTHRVNREINREKSVHLEITVNSNDSAMMRLREVLMERQIKLVADASVSKLLQNKNQAETEFLVYAENLTTEDVAKLMRELSHRYVVGQGMNQKLVDSPYKKVELAPSEEEDLAAVAKIFGVEISAVDFKNRKEVKETPKRERQAVVMSSTGTGTPSPEVRQFINQRQAPQAGTLQVIIKIRQK